MGGAVGDQHLSAVHGDAPVPADVARRPPPAARAARPGRDSCAGGIAALRPSARRAARLPVASIDPRRPGVEHQWSAARRRTAPGARRSRQLAAASCRRPGRRPRRRRCPTLAAPQPALGDELVECLLDHAARHPELGGQRAGARQPVRPRRARRLCTSSRTWPESWTASAPVARRGPAGCSPTRRASARASAAPPVRLAYQTASELAHHSKPLRLQTSSMTTTLVPHRTHPDPPAPRPRPHRSRRAVRGPRARRWSATSA